VKTSIFYLNDEPQDVSIKVLDNRFDPVTCTGDVLTVLKSTEGRVFELDIPDDSIIYVKKWKTMALISYIYLPATAQLDEDLQRWVDQ
jgi:hypothetical protein